MATDRSPSIPAPLLQVDGLSVHFRVHGGMFRSKGLIRAVDGISFCVGPGETLGLIGESGSGKSTVARAIVRLNPVTAGTICFQGRDITHVAADKLKWVRRELQMVFQDPYSSLNPRMKVADIVAEPLLVHGMVEPGDDLRERVIFLLRRCELPPEIADRYPHALSGGQQQRVALARALSLEPRLILADEPTSALDVSVQAQIVNLLTDLQSQLGLSYLVISHNLAVVRHISNRVVVMYAGEAVEATESDTLCDNPRHPYTEALLSASLAVDPDEKGRRDRIVLSGEVPSPMHPPAGCRFHTRCVRVQNACRHEAPPYEEKEPGHWVSCWFA